MTRRTVAQYDWAKLEFDETILTKHFSKLSGRDIDYVVVHHMTIKGSGNGSALNACWSTWQNREASAHYGADGSLVRQFVWDKDFAWATGSNAGNLHGISIEHANSALGPKWTVGAETWKTGARLAANLHKVYKLGRPVKDKTLRKHGSFTATACPGPYLGGIIWSAYVAEAQRVYDEITAKPKPIKVPPTSIGSSVKVPAPVVVPKPKPLPTPAPTPKPPAVVRISERVVLCNCACYNDSPAPKTAIKAIAGKTGIQTEAYRIPLIGAKIALFKPDVVVLVELSKGRVDDMDRALPGFVRAPGGEKGREIYLRKGLTYVASGIKRPAATLNGDDKPYVWCVYREAAGTLRAWAGFHNENENGIDKRTGLDADKIRPIQMDQVIQGTWAETDKCKVPRENVGFAGDGNSYTLARLAAEKRGLHSAPHDAIKRANDGWNTHNGWKPKTKADVKGDVYDITLTAEKAEAWTQFLSSTLADHHITITDRKVLK